MKAGLRIRCIGPVGRAAYAEEIRGLAGRSGLDVRLEGNLPPEELLEAYQQATFLVMPSQPYRNSMEGLGIALLEAQFLGCPVIGTRTGGIPEALVENETGLLVPTGDPHAMAMAMERMLANAPMRESMGRAGAAFVRGNFSWPKNLRALKLA